LSPVTDLTAVQMVNPAGRQVEVAAERVDYLLGHGFRYPTIADVLASTSPPPPPPPSPPPSPKAAKAEKAAVVGGAPPAAAPPPPRCQISHTLMEFDVSPRCTRKCKFCAPGVPAGRRTLKSGLSLEAHNRVVDELAELGFNRPDRWVVYCGHGDPLLCPWLREGLRYTAKRLPDCKMTVYTNGDRLDEEMCRFFEAIDLHGLFWDNYGRRRKVRGKKRKATGTLADIREPELYEDDATTARVLAAIRDSEMDPDRVYLVDHTAGGEPQFYSSRCSSLYKPDVSKWLDKPCGLPSYKLMLTDDGRGGPAWMVCCEDLGRQSLTPYVPLKQLLADWQPKIEALLAGRRREAWPICLKCDRDESTPPALGCTTKLVGSRLWPPPARLPAVPKGKRRLVIMPLNAPWRALGELVARAVDELSTVPGETLLLWNDPQPAPESLRGPGRVVWESPSYGWKGIAVGLGRAYRYALEKGFDWTIKLDTDTAILARGWDAALCHECPADAQIGTYMDESLTGSMDAGAQDVFGLFLREHGHYCRWARGMIRRNRRGWDHLQGGLYVFGRQAMEKIDRVVGLEADDQEVLSEDDRIGEDVYFDSKAKLSGVRQSDCRRVRIWFRREGASMRERFIRYHRDARGVVAVHPVKDAALLERLLEEALG